jgi:hypothetical protein
MGAADGPFGSDTGEVPFSDAALLVVSMCGFLVLSVTVYSLVIRRLKSAEELESLFNENADYAEKLKRRDVSTLSRAERRARAHAIMKEERRALQIDSLEQPGHDLDMNKLSRKERQKVAKAREREERKLFEKERLEEQQALQEKAHQERLRRQEEQAKLLEQQAVREHQERVANEERAQAAWNTFLSSRTRTQTVDEWVNQAKEQRCIYIKDITRDFDVSTESVIHRIKQLVSEKRLMGVIDRNSHFLFLTDEELDTITSIVVERGSVSLSDISDICEHVLQKQ